MKPSLPPTPRASCAAAVCLVLASLAPGTADATDLQVIRARVVAYHSGLSDSPSHPHMVDMLAKLEVEAQEVRDIITSTGGFQDLNYSDEPGVTWDVHRHFVRIFK